MLDEIKIHLAPRGTHRPNLQSEIFSISSVPPPFLSRTSLTCNVCHSHASLNMQPRACLHMESTGEWNYLHDKVGCNIIIMVRKKHARKSPVLNINSLDQPGMFNFKIWFPFCLSVWNAQLQNTVLYFYYYLRICLINYDFSSAFYQW